MQPVHVVGYGIIDGLGSNPYDCYLNSLNDKDYSVDLDFMIEENLKVTRGIRVDDNKIVIPESFNKKMLPTMTRSQKMALHVVDQALTMSNLPISSNVAVIYSTVTNDAESFEYFADKMVNNKKSHPFMVVIDTCIGCFTYCLLHLVSWRSLRLRRISTGLLSVDMQWTVAKNMSICRRSR